MEGVLQHVSYGENELRLESIVAGAAKLRRIPSARRLLHQPKAQHIL